MTAAPHGSPKLPVCGARVCIGAVAVRLLLLLQSQGEAAATAAGLRPFEVGAGGEGKGAREGHHSQALQTDSVRKALSVCDGDMRFHVLILSCRRRQYKLLGFAYPHTDSVSQGNHLSKLTTIVSIMPWQFGLLTERVAAMNIAL